MRVLVTGASGFIGSHLCDALTTRGHHVAGVDRDGMTHWQADLLDPDVVSPILDHEAPDVVVHLAAQVGRLFGEDDIRHTIRSNAEMTAAIAKACADRDVRLMYASTSEVYGDQGDHECRESDPLTMLPHNVYGLSKRWGEEICRLYTPPDDLAVMRFSMPYGPGVVPGRGRAALPNILWQATTGQPIPIHRGAERSWCWIGDTVRAVVMLLEGGHHGAWNIGRDDDARALRSLAELACDMTDAPRSLIQDVDPPAAQTVVKRLSTEKLRGLGWAPTVEVLDGMAVVLEWVRQFDRDGEPVKQAA